MTLPGPDAGRFTLADLINPGHCPTCHGWHRRLWHYTRADHRTIVVGCEACATRPAPDPRDG